MITEDDNENDVTTTNYCYSSCRCRLLISKMVGHLGITQSPGLLKLRHAVGQFVCPLSLLLAAFEQGL